MFSKILTWVISDMTGNSHSRHCLNFMFNMGKEVKGFFVLTTSTLTLVAISLLGWSEPSYQHNLSS